jgi:hypothetical protein
MEHHEKAYIVDENVDFAQLFHRGCYCGVDCFVVAHIGCSVDDFAARIAGSLELLLQSTEFVLTTSQRRCHESTEESLLAACSYLASERLIM